MSMGTLFSGPFGIVLGIFLLIISIMWFLLPFAIVQIHRKTIELVDINRQILHELRQLNSDVTNIIEDDSKNRR